jgi:hypothetical protein
MSTKTTFKRVALVAVAALGMGVLSSVAPANAAARGLSVNIPSVTVVQGGQSPAAVTRAIAAFRFTVKDSAGDAVDLASGESITVTLENDGLPAAVTGFTPATTDFTFLDVNNRVLRTVDTAALVGDGVVKAGMRATDGIINGATGANNNCVEPNDGDNTGNYCIGIVAADAEPATFKAGFYTFTARVGTSTVTYATVTFKLRYVATANDSGALITVATAGNLTVGSNYNNATATSTSDYIKATVTDANLGYVINAETGSASTASPALTVVSKQTSAAGVVSETHATGWAASDTGTAGIDFGSATGVKANDGVYGINMSATAVAHDATLSPATIEVRYGSSVGTATIAVLPASAANAASSTWTVTGTGLYNATAAETTTAFIATQALTWNAPLTTTSVTLKVRAKDQTTAVQDTPLTFTVTWTGHSSGSVTPASGATGRQTVRTNSSGDASITITQTAPIQGSQAVVAVTGAQEGAFGSQTILWKAPELTTLTEEVSAFTAAIASTNVVRVKATDQFGNVMSGVVVQPSLSSTSESYGTAATNLARASLTTGADGYASLSLVGPATAVADDFESVSFSSTHGGVATVSSGSTVITYGTVPVIATLSGYYNTDQSTTAAGTWTDLFNTTGIGATTALDLQPTLNYSLPIVISGTSTTDSQVQLRVRALTSASAAATGVPVTVTASAGGHFTDSCTGASATVVTTKVCYPNATGYIYINTIGTGTKATFTFTAGTVTTSQTINYKNATTDARTVTLTGTADNVVAKVTDRFGNAVSGVTVQISTSTGTLGGGQKTASYTTISDGTVTVSVDSNDAATVTAYQTTANDSASLAGYVGAVAVDSTLAAGARTATLAVTGTGTTGSVAQAAADAAAEATDAANAATDAANAAAEAADAATAAAQDAADAVAALSAQVSSLISGLKAQLTALTNLVIKIQKKVKA